MIKARRFKSVLGKQDNLVEDTSEAGGKQYINICNGHFTRRNRTKTPAQYMFNLPLNSAHTYFCIVLFDNDVSNLNLYNYDATLSKITAFSKNSLSNGIYGTVKGISKLDSIHIWQGNDNMPENINPLYTLYIDLTEYGLDDLTAQQFYNTYISILPDVGGDKLSTVKKIYKKQNGEMVQVKRIYTKYNNQMVLVFGEEEENFLITADDLTFVTIDGYNFVPKEN